MYINRFKYQDRYGLNISIESIDNIHTLSYTASYVVGISGKALPYRATYKTNNLTSFVFRYTNTYQHFYDDTSLFYSVKYVVNREVASKSVTASFRYVTTAPDLYVLNYRLAYTYQKTPNQRVLSFNFKYTTTVYVPKTLPYSFSYKSRGSSLDTIRMRHNLKYETSNVSSYVFPYKLRYNVSSFSVFSNPYNLSYSTVAPNKVINDSVLLKTDTGRYDLLVRLRGTLDKQADNYFYVMTNLPKYQLLEFTVDDELPYITRLDTTSDLSTTLFNPNEYEGYMGLCDFLIKGINPNTPTSLDVYTLPDYIKANTAKSYFFSTKEGSELPFSYVFNGDTYISKNTNAFDFQYEYLNFVSTQVIPTFSLGDSCCFSQKILPPNSNITGGGCSPF